MGFACTADHRVKIKEKEKSDKCLDLDREIFLKKLWNWKVTVILDLISALGTIPKSLVKELEYLEIRGDNLNYNIVKIGQNTEKNTVNLRKFVVTQPRVKDHPLEPVWENHNNNKT